MNPMFCYQCEQTAKGTGCTVHGVCGKDPETSALQDLLVHVVIGIGMYANRARVMGAKDREVDVFVIEALFTTVTNVDFDPARIEAYIRKGAEIRDKAKALYEEACKGVATEPEQVGGPAAFALAATRAELVVQGLDAGIEKLKDKCGEDVAGLKMLIVYGLKGTAAYADHARILNKVDDHLFGQFHEVLDVLTREGVTTEQYLTTALKVGSMNLRAMELLDAANTGHYGHPEPTQVRITPIKGKAILISGHDLKDLDELLKQTEGKGINVYTHGEMLSCNAYPGLKKHKHLVGNFGNAWQFQQKEFAEFPGAVLMTTNCIQKPQETYKKRIFTSGLVAWPGVTHIAKREFKPVIKAALAAPGFKATEPEKRITIGFGHQAVLAVADKVVEAVKSGVLKHFFLIGGCDGAKPGRSYYTVFAQEVPKDCVILTLACGKYRFNKLDFGDIGGIPRLLDCGQCNDAFSAVQIALALAATFHCDVNELPLTMVLSWYEQKAVAILLTLLSLGIKNIKLGPSMPAFVTPPVLKVLVEKFSIAPVTTPDADLKQILKQ